MAERFARRTAAYPGLRAAAAMRSGSSLPPRSGRPSNPLQPKLDAYLRPLEAYGMKIDPRWIAGGLALVAAGYWYCYLRPLAEQARVRAHAVGGTPEGDVLEFMQPAGARYASDVASTGDMGAGTAYSRSSDGQVMLLAPAPAPASVQASGSSMGGMQFSSGAYAPAAEPMRQNLPGPGGRISAIDALTRDDLSVLIAPYGSLGQERAAADAWALTMLMALHHQEPYRGWWDAGYLPDIGMPPGAGQGIIPPEVATVYQQFRN